MDRILIVDNEPSELRNLKRAAAHDGADRIIKEADSAATAIELIARESFDVVVTDLKMETPHAGLGVLEAALKRDPLTQVILVTAHGDERISERTIRMGAFDYLDRMSDIDVPYMIAAKITKALEFRRALAISATPTAQLDAPAGSPIFLNAWFPDHLGPDPSLPIGQPSLLRVNLGPLKTSCLVADAPLCTMERPHLLYTLPYVDILVICIGAKIDSNMKRLTLPPGAAASVNFQVTPCSLASFRLAVNVLVSNEPIHRSTFTVRTSAAEPLEVTAR
jgi:CheY-like chemotaxis protein